MNPDSANHIYFVGIGGIGMSALARYFFATGKQVSGYDRHRSELCEALEAEGMEIHYSDSPDLIPTDIDYVVYTPAIPDSHQELQSLKNSDLPVLKRSEVLGRLVNERQSIAVAGTHGKTTISTMVAYIMSNSALGCTAFLGGISSNFDSNYHHSSDDWFVVEADEYDRSFHRLNPQHALISSIDPDHLDVYEDHTKMVRAFVEFADQSESLLIRKDLEQHINRTHSSYSITDEADYMASNIRIESGSYVFSLRGKASIDNIELGLPGRHNVENAVAAAAICHELGIGGNIIRDSLSLFKGVQRRFDVRIKTDSLVFVDDYAHHPVEISSCLNSVKELFPNKKITAVFQPHLYTRTRDFAEEFAASLDLADELILLPIYPAREKEIEGVSSQLILDKVSISRKNILAKNEFLFYLKSTPPEVLVTLGAGDISELLYDIEKTLQS